MLVSAAQRRGSATCTPVSPSSWAAPALPSHPLGEQSRAAVLDRTGRVPHGAACESALLLSPAAVSVSPACTSLFSSSVSLVLPQTTSSKRTPEHFHRGCSAGPPWVTRCAPPQAFHCPESPLPCSPAGSRPPQGGLAFWPCRQAPVPEAGGAGISSGHHHLEIQLPARLRQGRSFLLLQQQSPMYRVAWNNRGLGFCGSGLV